MRKIILFTCLLAFTTAYPQFEIDNPYEGKIEKILGEISTIKQLFASKKQIESQLLDIQQWTKEGTLSEASFYKLKSHYESYSEQMNLLISELCSDFANVDRVNKLKGKKLNTLIKNFSENHFDQLQNVKHIYEEDWKPALEMSATEANSKALIPTLLVILEFGDSIFSSLKELFSTGSISKENREKLFGMGLQYATNRIENKLKYPQWNEIVVSYPKANYQTRDYTHQAKIENSSTPFIGLRSFYSNNTIGLQSTSKKITVGTSSSESVGNLFTTQGFMKNGDRFNVVMSGYEYVYFFYFDTENEAWTDPLGKRIVVGNNSSKKQTERVLPSSKEFFEIEGPKPNEEFLILISNQPISTKERLEIMNSNKRGALFMEQLQEQLEMTKTPVISQLSLDSDYRIELPHNEENNGIIPILIMIEKQTL